MRPVKSPANQAPTLFLGRGPTAAVGADGHSANHWLGEVAEIMAVGLAKSAVDQAEIRRALANRWAIRVSRLSPRLVTPVSQTTEPQSRPPTVGRDG